VQCIRDHLISSQICALLRRNRNPDSLQNDCCQESGKITAVYNDMMLTSKHCNSIYFRCKTAVLAFTLSGTVVLLLTDLTSASDDKSIGIEYCQKISEKVSLIPTLILHTKSIADACINTV